jgi:hypothetical protein
MSDSDKTAEQWNAFQKIWLETFSKLGETAFTFNPQTAPPEILRNIRGGILQSLANAWEEFLRSPQFLEGMKQWMDNALSFRQMTSEFMAKAREGSGGITRNELDSVLAAIEHLERRLLDRIEEVATRVDDLAKGNSGAGKSPAKATAKPAARPGKDGRRLPRRRAK